MPISNFIWNDGRYKDLMETKYFVDFERSDFQV